MQIYNGTYLKGIEHKDFSFDISDDLLNNGNFLKFCKWKIYGIIRKTHKLNPISDDIQIFIMPNHYNLDSLENIYCIELLMPNQKKSFSGYLEVLFSKEFDINILDCRGVESVQEELGKVELIVECVGDIALVKAALEDVWKDDVNKKDGVNKKDYVVIRKSFENQLITNRHLYNLIVEDELTKEDLFNEKNETQHNYLINFITRSHTDWETFRTNISKAKCRYLGITSFSDGNFISVKFKSSRELILPLHVIFTSNEKGLLYTFINSLYSFGVSLKLISSQVLGDMPECDILFDIANTKLNGYKKEAIEKLIDSKLDSTKTKISIKEIKDYYSGDLDLFTQDIITESESNFRKNIKTNFYSIWKERLEDCVKNCNNSYRSCFLTKPVQKKDFEDFLEKIENLAVDTYLTTIPPNLKPSASNLKTILPKFKHSAKNCSNIKKTLGEFYKQITEFDNDAPELRNCDG